MGNRNDYLSDIESKFKAMTGIKDDLATYPLRRGLGMPAKANKIKSKEFGEVFTPLWLADEMIGQVHLHPTKTSLDLCAGYGQFTVRILRYLAEQDPNFDCAAYLRDNHTLNELQLSSCYKILCVFGTEINLLIGDALKLDKVPEVASGIWCYIETMNGWVPLTESIKKLMVASSSETEFVGALKKIIADVNQDFLNYQRAVSTISAPPPTPEVSLLIQSLVSKHQKNPSNYERVATI